MDSRYVASVRAGRLLAALLALQRRGGRATAAELARELEVSVRTVYRDVATLQAAGVPLWPEPGPAGGVRHLAAGRTTLDGLSADEAASLFLAGAAGAAAELGLGSILAVAQSKLLSTLPPELHGRAQRIRARFLLDAPGWFHPSEPIDTLPTIAEALWSDRYLRIRYRRADRTVARRVAPLGLVFKAGTWYLVATVGRERRTYRVGRIMAATVDEERFDRPAVFDLAQWWAQSEAVFNREILRDRVRLRLSPAAQRLLPHVTDHAAATDALSRARPDRDGWVAVDIAVESHAVAAQQFTALGDGVEVLEPPNLRAALADIGRAMAATNA
jgi:predicted DNA-binding transcriptional regulator YafY